MNAEYRDDGGDLFLLRECREDQADRMALRMLESFSPEGLLPVRFRKNAGRISAMYRISGLTALPEAMKGPDPEAVLRAVSAALSDIGPVLQAHFLSPGLLSLEPSEIFLDSGGKVLFLCLPAAERSFQRSLQFLMEFFLRQMNPQEERKVLLLYGLYQKSREETAVPGTLFSYYREWEKENAPEEAFPREPVRAEEPEAPFPESRTPGEAPIPPVEYKDYLYREEPFPEPFSVKLKAFLKKHRYDLLIAGIVIIGILLFILL